MFIRFLYFAVALVVLRYALFDCFWVIVVNSVVVHYFL